MKVDIKQLKRVMAYLAGIESVPLEEITWMDGEKEIIIKKENLERFKFTGLNNRDFALFDFEFTKITENNK